LEIIKEHFVGEVFARNRRFNTAAEVAELR
jgi:hypothetical protein